MEKELNIAAILKEKPKGTKLWSPISGDCKYEYLIHDSINVWFQGLGVIMLSKKGKWNPCGETIIFPSKRMQDWSKFAWKKGDVLVGVGQRIIFEKFIDENYTKFQGKYSLSTYEDRTLVADKKCYTSDFRKLDDNVNVKNYFKEIEERLGGNLNRETLEIEKTQPEFKDGDIVVYGKSVAIFRKIYNHTLYFYVSIDETFGLLFDDNCASSKGYRFATDSEKQQFFDALAKVGKAWDAEKKAIVDLNTNIDELKPFDKVLIKDNILGSWKPALFWKKVDAKGLYPYMIIGGKRYRFCVPYKGNEHLLDTTK